MTFIHANDAAMGDSAYTRREQDFYPTEAWVTQALLRTLKRQCIDIPQHVWEPACGDGAMSKELARDEQNVVQSSDLIDRGFGAGGIDFLNVQCRPYGSRSIITNPPYGDLAEAFVRHAIDLTKPAQGLVAMLLRNEWDCASSRTDLFEHEAFLCKIILTARPRWIADSTGSPRHNYSWYCWSCIHGEFRQRPMIYYAGKGKRA